MNKASNKFKICLSQQKDRKAIYKLRHEIYAKELGQHPENKSGMLSDVLDDFNTYLVAFDGHQIVGFITVTPPRNNQYSVDKYVPRDRFPFCFDQSVYEIRLLTVAKLYRHTQLASLLMYAAFRWIESQDGKKIIAIGRREVLDIYLKVGLKQLKHQIVSGKVTFELLNGDVSELRDQIRNMSTLLTKLEESVDWELPFVFNSTAICYHGGAFFKAIGEEFDALERHKDIINADVLDAWFPPSPHVIEALKESLPWIIKTSPPVDCRGLIDVISRVRDIPSDCILTGGGSSDCIYLAFQKWLTPNSRVLITDPSYGEYAHVLEKVIECKVDRIVLSADNNFQLDLNQLNQRIISNNYDMVVLVNPANPTGEYIPKEKLIPIFERAPQKTKFWIDEAYLEYVGPNRSLESYAIDKLNVIICKSMSKVYALSGLRVAYLCAPSYFLTGLKKFNPPWAVSLPAQIAAVYALQDPNYYLKRYQETSELRGQLARNLAAFDDWKIIQGASNFIVCCLPHGGPNGEFYFEKCREHNLFIRNIKTMGNSIDDYKIRIAIKNEATNKKIVNILTQIRDESLLRR